MILRRPAPGLLRTSPWCPMATWHPPSAGHTGGGLEITRYAPLERSNVDGSQPTVFSTLSQPTKQGKVDQARSQAARL